MNTWWKKHLTSPVINVLGRRKEARSFSKPPVLIGGCGRSGTTLLLAVLSAHPAIYAFPHEVDAFTSWSDQSGRLTPDRLDRLYRHLLTHRVPRAASRWCEKRPFNVRYIPEILEYLPEGTCFIHIARDPRAVCTSRHPQQPDAYWVSLDRYAEDVQGGLKFRDHPQVLTLRYEDLILNTQKSIQELCSFIGEDLHPHIEHWYDHATVRSNRAWYGGLIDIQRESLEKWRKPEHAERVGEIERDPRIRQLMRQLGYLID